MSRYERLVGHLSSTLGRMAGIDPAELDLSASFLDMGADSLALLQISQTVQDSTGIKVPFRLLLDDLGSIESLAAYLDQRMPAGADVAGASVPTPPAPPVAAAPPLLPPAAVIAAPTAPIAAPEGSVEAILARQVELLPRLVDLMSRQVDLLRQSRAASSAGPAVQAAPPAPAPPQPAPVKPDEEEYVPYKPIRRSPDQELTSEQEAHLAALIARVTARTQGSKRQIDLDRAHHADSRTVTGFRRLWKELCYNLVVTDGYGGRVRDVDGNEYVDLSMGFGALLFGHSPRFLVEPLIAEVRRGVRLGPQSYLAGEVARLISKLTGAERVCFCNSGTEAVMTALRIARARTGRDKVAIFAGSYHGTADEVLARGEAGEDGGRALPLAPGVPPGTLADMMVFRYNRPQSLAAIRRHAHELAAVLIEPPRSRTPDIRPLEFLQELRRITAESGTVLIFDEVVTGFRTHPGGAQAIFDLQADLTTYGKAVAGGMPIGIVAGKARYMDAVDGGAWRFGDDSVPEVEMTYHAGTFCKHPYTMAVAKAVLEHLDAAGPALQEGLNRRTDELVRTLNDFFAAEDYPFKVVNFGSLFRFTFPPTLRLGELFYYHLLEHGVYVWEGRNCFLCTAHTEQDIAQIVAAAQASARAMREGGVIPPAGGDGGGGRRQAPARPAARQPDVGVPLPAGAVPLTEAQEHLWILSQLGDEVSRAYNESMTLHLRGALDVEALRRALETVVARHEALRTSFALDGTWQRFMPPGPVELPRVELPAGGDRQARIAAWLAAEAGAVFPDLAAGPLYRARLLRVEEGWHLLVLTLHHLVSDGFSNGVVLREMGHLYSALTRGTSLERAVAELPPPVPFSRYVARQRDERAGSEMAAAEAYWLAAFATPVPLLDLPADRPRPPLQGHLGDRAQVATGPRLAARIRQLAREQGCTLFVTLLAAYRVLLHRLTGQDDLVVGTPAAGQIPAGGGHLVGYCVNLLPLRSRVAPETTAAACLKEMRGQVLDAYEHQIYPFQRLLKKIDLPRDPSRLPLVAVTFTTEKAGHYRFAGLETELALNNNGGSKFELYLNVVEAEDDLVFDCEHNSYLFGGPTVRRWLGHLCQLLESMAETPRQRLRALPLLSAVERHQITAEWNDTAAPYDRQVLIHQLFEAQARRCPEAPAVAFGDTSWTYGELNAEANRLAHHLASLGVEGGRPVAVLLHRSLGMVAALLGVLKAGGAYVPIEAGHPAERVQAVLAALEIPVVITDSAELPVVATLRERLPFLSQVIVLDTETDAGTGSGLTGRPVTDLPPRATAEHPAYVIFTSGSTGRPKGVLETHRPVVNLIRWVNDTYGVGPKDRVLFVTSPSFDLSVYDVFGLLAAGGSIRVASEEDLRAPERLIAWLATDGITLWDSAPAALQQLVPFLAGALPAGAGGALRLVLQSGDWIPLALPGRVRQHFPQARVVALGGATEATIWSNRHEVWEIQPHWSSIPYGRPIANARYYVLDAELAPAPLGVAGDLWIGGECLSSGYFGDPALTAGRYLPDPCGAAGAFMYRTGDRARFLADGEIEFLGRLDNQVKVRGFRIELGEIETVLTQHPAVRDAAVLARGEAREERRLVAYVVPRATLPAAMPPVEELRAWLKERLPEPMVPAAFVALEALPVTANGKLDRKALPAPEAERPHLAVGFEPPASATEERLAAIWQEALGVERVGRRDGFFDLGGDSILAVRIVARARREGLPLTPAHVFQLATIAELAAVLDGPAAGGETGAAEVPLTPIQRWFFARHLPHPGHFNQALVLRVPADLGAGLVEQAFAHLLREHEALRLRYGQEGPGIWRQTATAEEDEETVRCERVDLSGVPAAERTSAIAAACARLQAGLDPERGPLVRLVLLSGGEGEIQRLAVVAHHLAVDVTSWRILTADLAIACEQLRRGEPVSPGPRTTPFREWAERLAAYARSAEVERQITLWTAAARARALPLPRDIQTGENTAGSAAHVAVELDLEETRALLHDLPRAFRTLTHEVLLAALARVLADLTGERAVLIDLEGNGREVELPGVNLARTVGWLTTLYPVLLELPPGAAPPPALLQSVKEQLRAIPQEGIGYGLLRYPHYPRQGDRDDVARRLAALPAAEVGFLYVGGLADVEAGSEGGEFIRLAEPTGPAVAPDNPRPHLLEVYAAVQEERLRTIFTYSPDVHRLETVERLAADFLAALRSLLAAGGSTRSMAPSISPSAAALAGTPSPADFPQADISQDELDDLLVRFGEDDE